MLVWAYYGSYRLRLFNDQGILRISQTKTIRKILLIKHIYQVSQTIDILLSQCFGGNTKTSQKICFANFLVLKIHRKQIYCTYVYMNYMYIVHSMTYICSDQEDSDTYIESQDFIEQLFLTFYIFVFKDRQINRHVSDKQTGGQKDGQTD